MEYDDNLQCLCTECGCEQPVANEVDIMCEDCLMGIHPDDDMDDLDFWLDDLG